MPVGQSMDMLLPTTDAGVAIQAIIWGMLTVAGAVATRNSRDHRILVIGVSLLGFGLMALRAVH